MAHGERVLLVSEDDGLRRLCHDTLAGQGYEATEAQDGKAARRLIATETFSIALVDLILPDAHGADIVRDIKEASPDSCTIVIAEFAALDSAMTALDAGAYDYLRKPIDMIDLVRVVNRASEAVRLQRHQRELQESLEHANAKLQEKEQRLREHLQCTADDMSALVALGKRLGSQPDPRSMLTHILDAALQLAQVAGCALFVRDLDKQEFVELLSRGDGARQIESARIPADQGLLGAMSDAGTAVTENDLLVSQREGDEPLRELGVSSALAAPLMLRDVVCGCLLLLNKHDGNFTPEDATIVSVLAREAAPAVASLHTPSSAAHSDGEEFVSMDDLTRDT